MKIGAVHAATAAVKRTCACGIATESLRSAVTEEAGEDADKESAKMR